MRTHNACFNFDAYSTLGLHADDSRLAEGNAEPDLIISQSGTSRPD